jgi:catechol 2,3-dioxygenase-like lactoylglutathione lyase family enzyme
VARRLPQPPEKDTALQITASTVSLTVDDVAASQAFFTTHLGYQEQAAADGFASLTRADAAVDIVLLRRGIEVLPAEQRDQRAGGLILAFTLTGLEAEEKRPWGERLFQITDPNGVIIQFVEWVPPAADNAEENV